MDSTALVTTLLLAIAGPVGIALGWWLGQRAERDRTGREERKNAYVAFTTASLKFRNANVVERASLRDERWEALAVLTLVAAPPIVGVAAHMATVGERLLDSGIDQATRNGIYEELWTSINEFTRLARADLKVHDVEAFGGLKWQPGDRLTLATQRRDD